VRVEPPAQVARPLGAGRARRRAGHAPSPRARRRERHHRARCAELGHLQGDPATHRVAGDVRAAVPELPKEVGEDASETGGGGRRPGGCQRRRGAEARQVDGDDAPVGGESFEERVPEVQAAAGAVDEQQGLARAVHTSWCRSRSMGAMIANIAVFVSIDPFDWYRLVPLLGSA
jgi:hypothetical protein